MLLTLNVQLCGCSKVAKVYFQLLIRACVQASSMFSDLHECGGWQVGVFAAWKSGSLLQLSSFRPLRAKLMKKLVRGALSVHITILRTKWTNDGLSCRGAPLHVQSPPFQEASCFSGFISIRKKVHHGPSRYCTTSTCEAEASMCCSVSVPCQYIYTSALYK